MPIHTGDITLLKSAVMADVPEGGGAPTGNVIADGVSNAIVPDISELDRAGGRVALRKVFAAVRTDDTDTYYGANVIVAEPPQDPRVSVTLFKALDAFEERASAQKRMESYLFRGAALPGFLLENHIAGQRVIQLFCRPEWEAPPEGAALCLVQDDNLATYQEQYVRVISVKSVLRKYSRDSDGGNGAQEYAAKIVSLELSDALRYNWRGTAANDKFKAAANAAVVRETVVADAGAYVGCVPLAQSAALGDFALRAASIYTQLVPSAQAEAPITAQQPYAAAGLPIRAGARVQFQTSVAWNVNTALQLPGGVLPGSLTVQASGSTITDAAGVLKTPSGTLGAIDYANGLLTLNAGSVDGLKTISYIPAAQLLRAPQSTCIDVTPESRSLSYVGFIDPLPERATLSISYMAQGRWYVLQDGGDGRLLGLDAAYGAGTINPDTGSYVVTLGALPDVGSALVIAWGVPTQETLHPAAWVKASQRLQLAPAYGQAVQPGTLVLTWPKADGSGQHTASAGANGLLTGDATGRLWTGADAVDFVPAVLPPIGAEITAQYVAGPKQVDNFAHPSRNGAGRLAITASLGAMAPGSVQVEWATLTDEAVLDVYTARQLNEMGIPWATSVDPTQYARDDGNGLLLRGDAVVGTVHYATGLVEWLPDVTVKIPRPLYSSQATGTGRFRLNYSGIEYIDAPSLYPNDESGYVKLSYNAPGSTSAQSETIAFAPTLQLVPDVRAAVVPGSVTLVSEPGALVNGVWQYTSWVNVWADSGTGVLRQRKADGSGWLTRGALDYLTGRATLASWEPGAQNNFLRLGCVTTAGEQISSEYIFRTASAPLRPGSLSIQFARVGGGVQTVTAQTNGDITAAGVLGTVDHQTGLVKLRFGERVVAAGNESEPWFHASAVDAEGKIFKPAPVAASTVRYTAVAYSYLPLDADLLGLDPVRLPSDGRVPIFRAGGLVVVGHTGRVTAVVSNGQTINCARTRLSRVRVVGHDGVVIHTGYSANLEAGLVTFTDVTGYSQPVTVEHRIEDMVVVRDVQITGELTFTRPLTHDYAAPGSYVSSALVAGDIFARVPVLFDQQTWGSKWQDTPDGAVALASYNAAQYPVQVTNRGAVSERWLLRFTNTTTYDVIGEHVGQVATGSTGAVCAPINPAAGVPYFTLDPLGWGAGWAAGNCLRFNTVGAQIPLWCVRTVQQGPETVPNDSFTLLVRGDVDAPAP